MGDGVREGEEGSGGREEEGRERGEAETAWKSIEAAEEDRRENGQESPRAHTQAVRRTQHCQPQDT